MRVAGALRNRRRFEPSTTAIVMRRMSRKHDLYRVAVPRHVRARRNRSIVSDRPGGEPREHRKVLAPSPQAAYALLASSHAHNRRPKWRPPRRNRIPPARSPSRTSTRLSKIVSPPATRQPPAERRGSSRKTARTPTKTRRNRGGAKPSARPGRMTVRWVRQSRRAAFLARRLVLDRGLRAREHLTNNRQTIALAMLGGIVAGLLPIESACASPRSFFQIIGHLSAILGELLHDLPMQPDIHRT